MGTYDGAEICKLVGLAFILNHLGKTFDNKNIGLHRDDGLEIAKNISARLRDKTTKELHKIFEQFGFKNTARANLPIVNLLDVIFDLISGKHRPYRKPNDNPLYIHKNSNHHLSQRQLQSLSKVLGQMPQIHISYPKVIPPRPLYSI